MADSLLHVRDRTGERTLRLDTETVARILAAARDSTDSLEELLKEARRLDATAGPHLAWEAREENDRPNAPFRVDLVDRVIAFPADDVRLARRGVFPFRDEKGNLVQKDGRTYTLGRGFTLLDSDGDRVLDEKASLRSEKALWAAAVPPNVDEAHDFRIDGTDLESDAARDIYVWTLSEDARSPTVDGRSVYDFRIEGSARASVTGRTHDEATRSKGSGKPGG